jgi:DNA polymerase (family 10)
MDRDAMVRILDEIAEMLDLKGENPFKSAAYRNGARTVSALGDTFDSLVETGALADVKGIGPALFSKITTLARTGTLPYYDELKASIPPGHFDLLRIPGMGPKKIQTLHRLLGIETLGELEYACRENRLAELKGFGTRTQAKLLEGIESIKRFRERRLAAEVLPQALISSRAEKLRRRRCRVHCRDPCGGVTRLSKTWTCWPRQTGPKGLPRCLPACPWRRPIVARGMTKVSLTLPSGINADLRIVAPGEFPYPSTNFTGCRAHNTALRGRAKKMGAQDERIRSVRQRGRRIPCEDDERPFSPPWACLYPPELREDMGEFEAAQDNILPRLVEHGDTPRRSSTFTPPPATGPTAWRSWPWRRGVLGYGYLGVSEPQQERRLRRRPDPRGYPAAARPSR